MEQTINRKIILVKSSTNLHDFPDALIIDGLDDVSNQVETLHPKVFGLIIEFFVIEKRFAHQSETDGCHDTFLRIYEFSPKKALNWTRQQNMTNRHKIENSKK